MIALGIDDILILWQKEDLNRRWDPPRWNSEKIICKRLFMKIHITSTFNFVFLFRENAIFVNNSGNNNAVILKIYWHLEKKWTQSLNSLTVTTFANDYFPTCFPILRTSLYIWVLFDHPVYQFQRLNKGEWIIIDDIGTISMDRPFEEEPSMWQTNAFDKSNFDADKKQR